MVEEISLKRDVKKYHNMTLDEIKAKYYIQFSGDELCGQLKWMNGKLSRLWQDVAYYYSDTKSQVEYFKKKLELLNEQLDYDEQKVKWRLITENKVMSGKFKWSDSARETAAFIETRNDKLINNIKTVKETIIEFEEELTIWHEVRENLRFISGRVDNSTMNIATENKFLNKEPTNIPQEDPKPKEEENVEEPAGNHEPQVMKDGEGELF